MECDRRAAVGPALFSFRGRAKSFALDNTNGVFGMIAHMIKLCRANRLLTWHLGRHCQKDPGHDGLRVQDQHWTSEQARQTQSSAPGT
jgi:hypothetical protein